jgi:peptidoglycan/xylan/chitin deacetylase (PgdA/CDA1 family)
MVGRPVSLLGARSKSSIKRRAARILPPAATSRRVVVLCYHSVHPSNGFASASPTLFDAHLRWLREHVTVVSLAQAVELARAGRMDRPAVAITFDDGYADNHRFALPLLTRHSVSAEFFLTSGLLERDPVVLDRFRTERSASLSEIEPLSWASVAEMQAAGMRFGSHTWSHTNLARTAAATLGDELRRSREHLEDRLGQEVRSLAYPYGKPRRHVTSTVVQAAAKAGYRHGAVVTFRGVRPTDSSLRIPRFFVTQDDVATLASKVTGRLDLLGLWQERSPLWLGRLVSPKDFAH